MSTTHARVEELLERWLASVELHTRYLQLDDAEYARVESWPKHQRPNAFVVKLARARLLELKQHLVERRDAGDAKFGEALELMSFLTSLLGSEHIERFIPLATGKPPDTSISATVEQPRLRGAGKPASRRASSSATASNPGARPAAHAKHGVTRTAAAAPDRGPLPAPVQVSNSMAQQVIADAVRLLAWGREWPAVAGLIARMADRPPESEIWKILRAHRTDIMAKARRGTG